MAKTKTIYDIAKEAGVSPATVSRVLTNNANVGSEKKKRVLEVIKKYNYKPNMMARRLGDDKTRTIGVLVADIRNPFYAALAVECEKRAVEKGYTLLLYNSLSDNKLEEKHLDKLEEQRVDAIILIGGRVDELNSDEHYVKRINEVTIKTPVIVTGKLSGSDCYQVNIDQIQAMELVVEHLIELGHTRVALLGGDSNVQSTFEKRHRFRQLLMRHGLRFYDAYLSEDASYNMESGYSEMNRLFDMEVMPTAVIGINDFASVGIVKSIAEHGLDIPSDISVASFDNTFISSMGIKGITSVDYNYEHFGKTLIDTAVELIDHEKVQRVQHIQSKLIIRESCSSIE